MKHNTPSFTRRLVRGAALFLSVLFAPALMAQEGGWSKSNYGFQLGVMAPMGELADMQETGFGLAGFYEKVFSSGFALRGRLEYTQFGEKVSSESEWFYGDYYTWQVTRQLTQVGVMLDLIWYKDLKDTIYPFAGIGYFNRSATVGVSDDWGSLDASEDLESELGYCVGLGLNFSRHFGVEAKYTVCEYNWVQISLLYRF
jgi:hypothetical protein